MPQQKYVRGSFLLEENVDDSKVYYEQHKAKVDEVIAWANQLHISYVAFGLSADHTYLCEYEVYGQTTRMCKGVASELKAPARSGIAGLLLSPTHFSHCSAGGCSTSSCNPGGYHNGYTNGIDPHG